MAKKIAALSPANLADIPEPCGNCRQWDLETRGIVNRLLREWGPCGFLAYEDKRPVGFTIFGPPAFFPKSGLFAAGPISSDAIFIACVFVEPNFRMSGLGKRLVQALAKEGHRREFIALEAFAGRDADRPPAVPVDFFLKEGFFVLRDDRRHPLVRLEIKSLATWSAKAEQALEILTARQSAPAKAPL